MGIGGRLLVVAMPSPFISNSGLESGNLGILFRRVVAMTLVYRRQYFSPSDLQS